MKNQHWSIDFLVPIDRIEDTVEQSERQPNMFRPQHQKARAPKSMSCRRIASDEEPRKTGPSPVQGGSTLTQSHVRIYQFIYIYICVCVIIHVSIIRFRNCHDPATTPCHSYWCNWCNSCKTKLKGCCQAPASTKNKQSKLNRPYCIANRNLSWCNDGACKLELAIDDLVSKLWRETLSVMMCHDYPWLS